MGPLPESESEAKAVPVASSVASSSGVTSMRKYVGKKRRRAPASVDECMWNYVKPCCRSSRCHGCVKDASASDVYTSPLAEEYLAAEAAAGVVESIADVKSLILQGLSTLYRAEVRAAGVSTVLVHSAEAQASASVPGGCEDTCSGNCFEHTRSPNSSSQRYQRYQPYRSEQSPVGVYLKWCRAGGDDGGGGGGGGDGGDGGGSVGDCGDLPRGHTHNEIDQDS